MGGQLYSLELIQSITRGDTGLICKLVKVFMEQTPETVSRMKLAYRNNDFETLKLLVHKVRPTFGYFAITEIERELKLIGLLAGVGVRSSELKDAIYKLEEIALKVVIQMSADFRLSLPAKMALHLYENPNLHSITYTIPDR